MDDTLKLWDIRNTKHPSQEWKELINLSDKTNISISPDEKVILTGTSVRKGFAHGLMMGFDVLTGDVVCATPISKDSVITIFWHPALNQIIVGSSDANIRVLYDPKLSHRGITTSMTKLEKRRPIDQGQSFSKPILTPCIYEDQRDKEMEKDPFNPNNQNLPSVVIPPEVLNPQLRKRDETNMIRKPEMPLQGPLGHGGRISASGTYTQYIMNNLYRNDQRDQDPREALLRIAKDAAEDPEWVTPAYQKTQPKSVFNMTPAGWESKRGDEIKKLVGLGNKKCA